MTRATRTLWHCALTCAWLLSALTIGTAQAASPGADLAHCAAIASPDARLACYDALSGRSVSAAAAPVAASAATQAPATPAPATPATATAGVDGFGLTAAQQHLIPVGPESISARVKSVTEAANGQVIVALDNQQVWQFSDPDALLKAGDAVTIKRGSLGSFLMTVPSKHTYRVRRTG